MNALTSTVQPSLIALMQRALSVRMLVHQIGIMNLLLIIIKKLLSNTCAMKGMDITLKLILSK